MSDRPDRPPGDAGTPRAAADPVGLCRTCVHSRRVPAGPNLYWLCRLSETDSRFPRYPRLPVVACDGYRLRTDDEEAGP